ncbi:hypothetical protein [Streptomyces sp. NPDC012510]
MSDPLGVPENRRAYVECGLSVAGDAVPRAPYLAAPPSCHEIKEFRRE